MTRHHTPAARRNAPDARPRRSRERTREKSPAPTFSFTTFLGEILIAVAFIALSFTFYEAYWTNLEAGRAQAGKEDELSAMWDDEYFNPREMLTPQLGDAFSRIHIPSFGTDFSFAVVEGTDDDDLLAGPGHYESTQMPGDAGNFAVAGHRVGKGAPFNDLGNLEVCDAIVMETATTWDIYRVLPINVSEQQRLAAAEDCLSAEQAQRVAFGDYAHVEGLHITTPNNVSVLDALPGVTTEVSDNLEGLITLTTCHPKFSNAERMIVHGMHAESIPKVPGQAPPVLQEA